MICKYMSLPRDIIFKILQDLDPISYYNCISISKHFYIYNSDTAKKLYLKNRCIGRTIDNMIYNLDIEGIEYMYRKFDMMKSFIFMRNDNINRDKIEKCADILSNVNCHNCQRTKFIINNYIDKNTNPGFIQISKYNCCNNTFSLSTIQLEYPILNNIFNTCEDNPLFKKGLFTERIDYFSICKYIREYICKKCIFISKNVFLIDNNLAELFNKKVNTKITYIMVENYLYYILNFKLSKPSFYRK
jgi:hypothetical protein